MQFLVRAIDLTLTHPPPNPPPTPHPPPPNPPKTAAAQDLMQFADRLKWYEAKFAADDMPDWNAATLVRRADLAPGVAALTLSVEVSRERVPLRNAYVAAGQRARVRANSGLERVLAVASAPPGVGANKEVRGLFALAGEGLGLVCLVGGA